MVLLGHIFGILVVIVGVAYCIALFKFVLSPDEEDPIIIERTITFEIKEEPAENGPRNNDNKPD